MTRKLEVKLDQLRTIGRELARGSQGGFGQSKEFLDLIKSIGEARSKAEEDRIVLHEIETLKHRIIEPDIPKRKMKEYIIRLVYVEMLGHDASFGYIHAVKMTHDDNLLLKRTGYLAVTLFLNEDHDLIILIVNTIQKDLKSDNYLVICAALNAVCKLINEETIPAVLPQVIELLGHSKEAVRKKAIMALHRFHQKSAPSVSHLVSNFRKRLGDNDPGVMGAALCPLVDLITTDVHSYKDLVISFVNILKQVAERRLPKSYDYHHIPAPFIQIRLLRILALLGSGDKQASENMYTIIGDIISKSDSSNNLGNAILYECICCVSSIYPNPKLLAVAADVIAKFLKSDSHNLKYLGIDALGRLIKSSPRIAEQHQLAVIDCLEDPDDTLKRKTFELLYKMTKSSNVEVIVERMIDYMISISDSHYKTYIASRCVELAEQFAPTNHWFIQAMNKVFEHAGDLVNVKVAHNLMRLIAEGFGEDATGTDSQLRSSAVESYLRIIGEPKLPSMFLQVICWVLGEYGTADGKYSASYIAGKLCDMAEAYSNDETVKAYAISALIKFYAFEIAAGKKLDLLPECQSFVEELLVSHSTDLQQRAYELQAFVLLEAHAIETIMPRDSSCEDIKVDKNLSFLNIYVQQSLEKGAQPYIPEDVRSGMGNMGNFKCQEQNVSSQHALRFEAYELTKPAMPSTVTPVSLAASTNLVSVPEVLYSRETHQIPSGASASEVGQSELKLRLDGVQRKWGRPTSSSIPSMSDSSSQVALNGVKQVDGASAGNSKTHDNYDSRKTQVEISLEKQKLAASLFGGSTKPEKRPSASQKVPKARNAAERSQESKAAADQAPPTPDLLDLGEPTVTTAPPYVDPFKQLEGLTDLSLSSTSCSADAASKPPDIMSIYEETTTSGQSDSGGYSFPVSGADVNLLSEWSNVEVRATPGETVVASSLQHGKGSNPTDSLEKDALVRQMGVTPSSQNPNLFRDLIG
ncbi:AP-4 complex subunit epsilon-like [Prosopis cineraria]|uniref:AP-4 complex subunit epsilon-like n=1 Tax=Prosopis cineraria TaxID=364024 RepID=UPI00240ECE32|nr:AP-4 complex subunit epsilon-like [Prosopis cineraria]